MPRYNVQHPATKEWRCFSTIVNNYVTDWMDEERYQRWRLEEYGKQAGEIRDANLMDYEEAEQKIANRKRWGGGRRDGRERDMSKYVIDLRPDCKVVQQICESDGQVGIGAKSIEYLEELNSDYINEHFGQLQDNAYQRGLEEGKKATWEATRKVIRLPEGVVLDLFTDCYSSECTALQVFLKYEGSEVIEKLKAYEEKQKADNDKFEFGDEIIALNGEKGCVVSKDNEESNMMYALFDGCRVPQYITQKKYPKTGKRYDIEKILGEMKGDNDK